MTNNGSHIIGFISAGEIIFEYVANDKEARKEMAKIARAYLETEGFPRIATQSLFPQWAIPLEFLSRDQNVGDIINWNAIFLNEIKPENSNRAKDFEEKLKFVYSKCGFVRFDIVACWFCLADATLPHSLFPILCGSDSSVIGSTITSLDNITKNYYLMLAFPSVNHTVRLTLSTSAIADVNKQFGSFSTHFPQPFVFDPVAMLHNYPPESRREVTRYYVNNIFTRNLARLKNETGLLQSPLVNN